LGTKHLSRDVISYVGKVTKLMTKLKIQLSCGMCGCLKQINSMILLSNLPVNEQCH